jgi:hypothetical protein
LLLLSAAWPALAQDRVTKVQNDRKEFSDDEQWIYNDLPRAFAQAKASGKPLMVVFRCIP